MRLPNLHKAPMRQLIKFRAFLKKRRFSLQKQKVCATFKRSYD